MGYRGLPDGGGGLSDYALVEPLAVAWHAINESGIKAGQTALVFGLGPVGLAVIQCLKARSAGDIIAVGRAPRRQQFAKQFGATCILDSACVDVIHKVGELTGGYGPPLAFDCAGGPSSLESATHAVCARGTVVNIAVWEKPVLLDPNDLVFHERKYIGSLAYQLSDFGLVIDALRTGRLRPESMITSKVSLSRVVEDGFKALMNEKDKHVKVTVDLSAS